MWESAIQTSTQRVTDSLLLRPILPNQSLAYEKISGAIAVRTAIRLLAGDQALFFVVPEATPSITHCIATALLIGDYAHANGAGIVPEHEAKRLLNGDVLIVTQAISESKAVIGELHIGGGNRLSDIWDVTPLTRYTSKKSTKPRVFLANPGWMIKIVHDQKFGAVIIDASHPRTFDRLPQLFSIARGCSSLRFVVCPPPSDAVLAACGVPSRTGVWLWDLDAKKGAERVIGLPDLVKHHVGERFLWICDSDKEAADVLSALYKQLTQAAKAADGKHYPGLRECWGIYNRLRQVTVPLAELEQATAFMWAGNIRARIKGLEAVNGHGSVAWDTTWPELLAGTKAAYAILLKRKESAKFWALAGYLKEFIPSSTPHLRIVLGSEAEISLLIPTLTILIDGFPEAVAEARIELVTRSKDARLVAEGQICPTVLLAPRTSNYRYLDVFASNCVHEFLYPHEAEAERVTQARLHSPWEPFQNDEGRAGFLEPLGFKPLPGEMPRPNPGRPAVVIGRGDGHLVTLVSDADVSPEIDIDALISAVDPRPFSDDEPTSLENSGDSEIVTEVTFANDETRRYYRQARVDVFFSEAETLQRHRACELQAGWQVVTFVDGHYDSLFQRLADMVNARLPARERIALELWKTSKRHLLSRFTTKRELFEKLTAHGLTSEYATFISWFGDADDEVLAPQQFEEFRVVASEMEVYANSRSMLDAAFRSVQNERGRNRMTGKALRRFLRAVISGDDYEEALSSARKLDAAMADVFAAVEVLEVVSVRQLQRNING